MPQFHRHRRQFAIHGANDQPREGGDGDEAHQQQRSGDALLRRRVRPLLLRQPLDALAQCLDDLIAEVGRLAILSLHRGIGCRDVHALRRFEGRERRRVLLSQCRVLGEKVGNQRLGPLVFDGLSERGATARDRRLLVAKFPLVLLQHGRIVVAQCDTLTFAAASPN